jgi:predicted nucleic acid-binding protein
MTKGAIVGDSRPLIALAIIEQLELLPKLFQCVVIAEKGRINVAPSADKT